MTYLNDVLDTAELKQLIADGFVRGSRHNEFPLVIYNYTAKAMILKPEEWSETLKRCRGLIVNDNSEQVIASGPKKFFNYGQVPMDEDAPGILTPKYDGSLGILYFWYGEPYIATRGSFHSPQAAHATELFREIWDSLTVGSQWWIADVAKQYTHTYEIIYPENRIVVDYGGADMLLRLPVFDIATGLITQIFSDPSDPSDPSDLFQNPMTLGEAIEVGIPDDEEGWVWYNTETGEPIKLKGEEYKRRHALKYKTSSDKVWVALVADFAVSGDHLTPKMLTKLFGYDGEEIAAEVGKGTLYAQLVKQDAPNELVEWVEKVETSILSRYTFAYRDSMDALDDAMRSGLTAKELYESLKHRKDAVHIMRMSRDPELDTEPLRLHAWKMARPEKNTFPFSGGKEDD